MSSERSDLQPVRHESGCCWALGRRAQPCRGAKRLASSARLPLAAHSCDSNNYAGRSASICGISTHLIPFRQSQGGGVSVLLTCLCFQMSLSCCRSAVSIPPGCSVLRTAQCLHQLTATCGLAAAGGSVPTPPTRMGRGTPLKPCSHPAHPRAPHCPLAMRSEGSEREEASLDQAVLISGGMQPLRGLIITAPMLLASATKSAEPTVCIRFASAQCVLTQLGQQTCRRRAAPIIVPEMYLFWKTE